LGTAAENGVCWQFDDALGLAVRHGDPEGAYPNHLKVLVDQDEVKSEKHPDRVDRVRGTDPQRRHRATAPPAPAE
jgi:hypothetical protein